MGYALAGFTVTGVDHLPQPNNPLTFIQDDALEYLAKHGSEFDIIHASPPCPFYSLALAGRDRSHHPDLVPVTRELLIASGRPYIIENVPGAPMVNPVTLCGAYFDLHVIRHRLFESNLPLPQPEHRPHQGTVRGGQYLSIAGHGGDSVTRALQAWRDAMGIPWAVTHQELANAIPPAYTRWLGEQILSLGLMGTPST